jgi:outer membrane protein W
MKKIKTKLAFSLIAACLPAFGQGSIEVQPFIGNMYGGTIPVSTSGANPAGINKIAMKSSVSYGVTAGMNFGDYLGLEFLWNHQPTQAAGKKVGGGEFETKVDVSNNQYHGNFLFYFKPADSKFRPYALLGLGATNSSGNDSSVTKFSYGLGGGVKYFFNDYVGVRAQARYAPTYLYSSNGGLWCNWYGYCWVISDEHYLNQGDITVGVTFRFGGR